MATGMRAAAVGLLRPLRRRLLLLQPDPAQHHRPRLALPRHQLRPQPRRHLLLQRPLLPLLLRRPTTKRTGPPTGARRSRKATRESWSG